MKTWFYRLTIVWLLLCPTAGFSFSFTVTPTHETCAGNGTLTFNVFDADPAGSIVFVVYKLPNLTTPYASLTTNFISGLTAGTYRIIARETVGGITTAKETDVTINSTVTALSYSVQVLNQACSNTSNVTVITSSGTAATYEIFFGPVTFPVQTSNTFSGVPAGTYRIRVIDNCGNALVQTFIVTVNPASLNVGEPVYSETVPPSCNSIVVSNTLTPSPGNVIAYPIQVQYILYLPGGTTSNTQILNSGNPTAVTVSQTFPYFINDDYTYEMIITDACGVTYTNNFAISNIITIESTVEDEECLYFFVLNTSNFAGSYTLNFDAFPSGFNPAFFNSAYPGPYTLPSVTFGSDSQSVPEGNYTVTVTDTCGKTETINFEVIYELPTANIVGNNNGCQSTSGQIIAFVDGRDIINAVITVAPSAYSFPLPHDVSSFINAGGVLVVSPVPVGDYTVVVTDECGFVHDPLQVTVPAYNDLGVMTELLHGCDRGRSSIEMSSSNGNLTSVIVLNAPSTFNFPLPFDVSNNIVASGKFYLNNLPAGTYTFRTVDNCGFTNDTTVLMEGYTVTTSDFSLTIGCGAFDVPLNFISNLTAGQTFWLQKLLDPNSGTWGHPETEEPYSPGTVPNSSTGIELMNNTINPNLIFNGRFRIVHHFTSYNNGSDINNNLVSNQIKDCIEILSPELTFDRVLAINDVYRVPCSTNGNLDVILFTSGEPPLHFTIVEKDGLPFFLDNGSSNIFQNLEPAIYKFQIEDNCGNTIIRTFDVSDLESLVVVYPTCNLFSCSTVITGNETFNLSTQAASILGIQSPSNYTISYFTSQTNAENNTNPITNITAFNPTTNPQTIYVRLIFNQFPNCYQTGSFDLISGQNPAINLNSEYSLCDGQPVLLDAGIGNLPTTTYSWSTGLNTNSVTISELGTTNVTVTATNTYGLCNNIPQSCVVSKDIAVTIVTVPEIDRIELHDWTANENSITVITTQSGDFEYSIDGINYQSNPNFTQLIPGLYTVYVRDTNGCRVVTQVVWLLNYPHYFTPNGDGIHDYWYVKHSDNEPHFQVYIFDRYGKLITGFPSGSIGWDGTLNGKQLFSDDYWFVVHREDGRILKGHFTLKR
ncbi:T9SS type B sorting domain-containing protein [Flavobacterium sp.]|uniref:T9SS type B sorting domain-containing protein n=1 Tax=Flavobacterium sp. TaxID=239 RepID=UPI00391D3381